MNDILYCCVIRDQSECRGGAPELLSAFGYDLSSWKDEESGEIRHTLYFQTEAESLAAKKFLEEKQAEFDSFGVVLRDPLCTTLKKEDWAEVWKIHFKTLVISERLAIVPSWEKFQPLPGQIVLTLDPGMSFGTGQHATTKFCLTALDRFIAQFKEEGRKEFTMLDAGAGSGILGIAAAKLGCPAVDAFDIDPDTIPVARENAQKNHIPEEQLSLRASSLLEYSSSKKYDLVAANILSSALLAGKEKLFSFCHSGTYLILAGILGTEYEKVRAAFEADGCEQIFSFQEKEWRSGAFLIREK